MYVGMMIIVSDYSMCIGTRRSCNYWYYELVV